MATCVRTCECALHPSITAEIATLTHCCRSAERTYVRNVELSVRTYVRTARHCQLCTYVRTCVRTSVYEYVREHERTYQRAYVSTKPVATVGTGTTRRTRPGTTGTTGTTTARPRTYVRTYVCTDVRRRAPFRLTATLAQPRRVRRSPERSPRVSATPALRTYPFKQTNARTHYVRMRFRTPRCTLADRLVLMAMAVAHHQKASRRELKHTCKRTYVCRTSKMQASKLAVTVT